MEGDDAAAAGPPASMEGDAAAAAGPPASMQGDSAAAGSGPRASVGRVHRWMVDKPFSVMGLCLFCTVFLMAIQRPLTVTLTSNAWYDQSHVVTRRNYAFEGMFARWNDRIAALNSGESAPRSSGLDSMLLYYQAKGKASLAEAGPVSRARKLERAIATADAFEEYCLLETAAAAASASAAACAGIASVATPGYPGALVDASGAPLAPDVAEAVIGAEWCGAAGERTAIATQYADRAFSCDAPRVRVLQSVVPFGGPLPGYASISQDTAEQNLALGNELFLERGLANTMIELQQALKDEEGEMEVFFGGASAAGGVNYGLLVNYLYNDMAYAGASMVAVFVYLAVQLSSLFLALCGILEIFLSVPLAFAVYSLLGFRYISFLQFMGVFIIMGIGADDIFVFYDAWKQSGTMGFSDEHERFKFAYDRAVSAMTVTSATSAMAFFATAFSPIPTVMCFGISMGLTILIDFVFVITWFPVCVLVYERHLESRCCACFEGVRFCLPCCKPVRAEAKAELGRVEKWFQTDFTEFFASAPKRRGVLAAFGALFVVVASVVVARLEVTGDFPSNMNEQHPYSQFEKLMTTKFSSGDGSYKVGLSIFFGVDLDDPVDREGEDPQSDSTGKPHLDGAFDLGSHDAQLAVLSLCETAAARTDLVFEGEVYCFMRDFVEYLNATGRDFYSGAHASELVNDGEAGFPSYLLAKTFEKWNLGQTYNTGLLIESNRVQFAWIGCNTTLPAKLKTLTTEQYVAIMSKWDKVLDEHNAGHPSSRAGQFCVYWYFVVAALAIVDSSVVGVTVSMIFAFLVLVVANRNWIVPFLAMIPIVGILFMVSFLLVVQGKTVDFIGSICLIVVIGLSIDYSVHLCHAFMESRHAARLERARDAVTDMGISVISGAVTTFGAAIFLVFTNFTFFNDFGIFMVATIAFSIVFALVLFIALVTEFGPTRDEDGVSTGDIRPLLLKMGVVKEKDAGRVAPEPAP